MRIAITRLFSPRLATLAPATTVLLVAACGGGGSSTTSNSESSSGGGSSGQSAATVTAMDFRFDPTSLTASAGAKVTVTFTNAGKVEHSFTLDNGQGEVEADGGGTKTLTFTAPSSGTLLFHCKYHPTTMKGTITLSS